MSILVKKHSDIIPSDTRSTISKRYKTITKAINREFWDSESETSHSFYVGSYGRNTAISTSDIDILVEIPTEEFDRFSNLNGNGPSRFLQAVKSAIVSPYPNSDVKADGQVIKINFSDGIKFEIVPAFQNLDFWGDWDGTYIYPDSNMGGNWMSTNPKEELKAMKEKNSTSNGLLVATCRHFRYIRDNYFSSYHLSGIVIDSFVYVAMGNWQYVDKGSSGQASEGEYEEALLNYFNQHSFLGSINLNAPGSNQSVNTTNSFECLKKVINKVVL
ncbi:nucleotidyltransferase domain-containing protein [Methanobrevibacter arboriphilus]|uniref:SMODS domain-containing nucleotidyltransferase n=1 Tax=Methanobrevibacter arboriphilus TaxID=39441 RepID=UPI0005B2D643|nr:nucleotidyltransferase domain-containing protein [Methanobrevibacter arboriphilus]